MSASLAHNRLLGPEREQFLQRVRKTLGDLRTALGKVGLQASEDEAFRNSIHQLDDLFLLVIVGEFNSGKSAFVNTLLGSKTLEEGVTPTTSKIQVLRGKAAPAHDLSAEGILQLTADTPLLEDLTLVDTPGTNAIDREHEALTQHFIPRADLVLFVTSADRPFTESERTFLSGIRDWGKKIVMAVNKADILEAEQDRERVRQFVTESFSDLLGEQPQVFLVSARQAFRAKQSGDEAGLAASGFLAIEDYIRSTLDEEERFRLKLLNPLGVGLRLGEAAATTIDARLDVLEGDIQSVNEINSQLDVYDKDMQSGFDLRMSDIDLILHQFEARGHDFFDEMVRMGRVFDLLNKSKVKADFERVVVGRTPQQIEDKVHEIIDWLVTSDLQQWRAIRERLEQRRTDHSTEIADKLSGGFEYDRARLLETVGRSAQETLKNYDKAREASRLAESVQGAVTNAALLEVGAVGLGAAVSLAATSSVADFTGIAAAGVMAVVGLFVLPHRRGQAKKELREKISALRQQLEEAVEGQFRKEISRSRSRIEDTIAPYTRFVRGERDHLQQRREEISTLLTAASALRNRLGDR